MTNKIHDLIIIGSGPAGLTAAIYAARAQLKPIVISGNEPGGQLTITTEVEDFPGFPDGIQGPELMERMKAQAEKFGVEFIPGEVTVANFKDRPLAVNVGEIKYESKSIIIATGASARWLNLPSEQKLIGRGVSSCAVCDGYFFKDKDVAIVGGGDAAAKEAIYLSKIARSVTLIHRRPELRAQKILQERMRLNPKIIFELNSTVEEVLGDNTVSGIKIKNLTTGDIKNISLAGVFVAIGHSPNTKVFREQVECDELGFIKSVDGVKTSVEGIFVAGDVFDRKYRQAITAAGMGCKAAMEAEEYIESTS